VTPCPPYGVSEQDPGADSHLYPYDSRDPKKQRDIRCLPTSCVARLPLESPFARSQDELIQYLLEKITSVPPRGAVSPLLLHQHPGVCILHMHSWIAGAGPAVGLRARLRDFSSHPVGCGSASTHREAPSLQSIIMDGEGGGWRDLLCARGLGGA
jgi:hypothetical protein